MNWHLLVSKSARKAIDSLPGKDQPRVEGTLDPFWDRSGTRA